MALWTDLATWRGPTVNSGDGDRNGNEATDRMIEHRGLVLHIAEGYFEGTIAWQKNPSSRVSSHFVVAKDGRIAQMVDTDIRSWAQRSGNPTWLSVENEGFVPGALTAQQVEANARLLVRANQIYDVPLQIATSPSGRGLGHHSMGAENGVDWGHPQCPGPAIIAQKPDIVARALELAGQDSAAPVPVPDRPRRRWIIDD
ncbi:N-acetylmuramoyl-L-alanine amidase [Micromonospora sp. NPDC050417]|uniref:N-acetylmuramoyl-L-alanine amidase n=1 Tax=Micromonospora sp. NPDC050417 TaxID=3364280 RepID=UPI0037BA81A1